MNADEVGAVGGRGRMTLPSLRGILAAFLMMIGSAPATAQEAGDTDLAKQLSNPVASLISVPVQFNYDTDIGPNDGDRLTTNVQPVIPVPLTDDWNVISRTVLPILWQDGVRAAGDDQFGLGDTLQSLFLSPVAPGPGGLIWGAGPVFLLPTSTDDLGVGEWGVGPTGVGLIQNGPWTVGLLANHIWTLDSDTTVNQTFLQPFVSYTTPDSWTFALQTETSYDWEGEAWSVPINAVASKLLTIGSQPIQIGAGLRYWAESPDSGPEGFGVRAQVTLLFPR